MNWKWKLALCTYIAWNLVEDAAPDVIIDQGVVRGKVSKNREFYEYLGIPYATTNKESRFQAPLPPPSWSGVFKAVDEHYSCPQRILGVGKIVVGDEDCLKINVNVPGIGKRPFPVMVYIHGGGFVMGSGGKAIYAPDFLVKHNVIVVTFNYRLGPLGFICLGIKEAPGNAGLRDQIAALKWVKRNIAAFGGDPDNVTVFGESAGATSTSLLVTSEAANNLFNKVIIQSGSAISPWAISRRPVLMASLLAQGIGYNTADPYELYNIFKSLPFETLTRAMVNKPWDKYFETVLVHLPCVEKSFPDVTPVVKELPYDILESNRINKVPTMMGFNDREGLFMVMREDEPILKLRNEGYLFSSDIDIPSEDVAKRISNEIKEFYFGKEEIHKKTLLNMSEVYTDTYFGVPEILETELLCENDCTVYNYLFKYSGSRNVVKMVNGYYSEEGAAHGDDFFYLFDAKVWPFWITKNDHLTINRMTTMWTNFAKYGDPTPKVTEELPVRWQKSQKNNMNFLYIDDELKMGPIPIKEAYNLWKNIYSKYRRKIGTLENV